jgi:hypothetical protein
VTFHEVRAHLGVETQRQRTEAAILRTTPALLGLFSLITVHAHHAYTRFLSPAAAADVRQAAWYTKATPTFADALALVRRDLWMHTTFCGLPSSHDSRKMPRALVNHLTDLLCYAT